MRNYTGTGVGVQGAPANRELRIEHRAGLAAVPLGDLVLPVSKLHFGTHAGRQIRNLKVAFTPQPPSRGDISPGVLG